MQYKLRRGSSAKSLDVDARVSARRVGEARGTACHSAITPPPLRPSPQVKGLSVEHWEGGSKVIVKRLTDAIPQEEEKKEQTKRGAITDCTWKSMRRLKSDLAEVARKTTAFTSFLTYPSHFRELCPNAAGAKEDFKKLHRWVSKRFRWFPIYWKREPQKNGVTHYHLLYFLLDYDEEIMRETMLRILRKWCEITTGKGTPFPSAEHEKQLVLHLHEKNIQPVKKGDSFFNYLGKYISKDSGDVPDGYNNEGGGRWWGKVNGDRIPKVERKAKVRSLGDKKEKGIMRTLYKLRDHHKQAAYDSLHPVAKNPRFQRDLLARSFQKKHGMHHLEARKEATRWMFKMDGARVATAAPIKAKANWHFGSVTFLGDPMSIIEILNRLTRGVKADHAARARIFGDNYQPLTNNENTDDCKNSA